MPVVKHVLNFSELISKAAYERKRLNLQQISNSRRLYTKLKTSSISYTEEEEIKENEKESVGKNKSEFLLPTSPSYRRILFISAFFDQFLQSTGMAFLRAIFYFIAFIIIAFETENDLSHSSFLTISTLNFIIDGYFCIECFSRLCTLIVIFKYPTSNINSPKIVLLDSLIELGSTLGSLTCGYSHLGSWFRLLRVSFLSVNAVRHTVHLDVLMSGITLGIRSLLSTWLLTSLVFAVYAACCMHFFGQNDPFHFGSMSMSLWTLFEMSTLDNWEKVLYINMYGCEASPYYYSDWINESINATQPIAIHQYGYLLLPICYHSEGNPGLAVVIFISFTLLCAFILMSIMIAVVTAGIRERIEEIQTNIPQKDPSFSSSSFTSSLHNTQHNTQQHTQQQQQIEEKESMSRESDFSRSAKNSLIESFDPELVLMMLKQVWKNAAKESKRQKIKPLPSSHRHSLSPHTAPSGRAYVTSQYSSIEYWRVFSCGNFKKQSIALRQLTNHPLYHLIYTLIIILAALLELIVLQETREEGNHDQSSSSSSSSSSALEWVQYLFQFYFMSDIILRVKAHYPDYFAYLENPWNSFDVVLTLLTLLPILATGTTAKDSLGLFRVGRILRVLRLVTWVETLDIILQAISNSMRALLFVVILMWIFFYNYAIMGVFLFRDNDPNHFGSLPHSFVTLFQVSTLSSWIEIARTNMYGCELFGYDTGLDVYDMSCENSNGLGWFAAWYFIIFIMIGVMVLVSLFTGVIITSMDLLRDTSKAEIKIMEQAKKMQQQLYYDDQSFDNLLEIFEIIDLDSNGSLSMKELKPLLEMIISDELDRLNVFLKADSNEDGQINFAEFFLIIDELQKYYILNRETADRKAKEGSEAREDYLRTENLNPIMNLLKNSFLSSIQNLNTLKNNDSTILQPSQHPQTSNHQFKIQKNQKDSLESSDEEENQIEVIDEHNIEEKVREFHSSSVNQFHHHERENDCQLVEIV